MALLLNKKDVQGQNHPTYHNSASPEGIRLAAALIVLTLTNRPLPHNPLVPRTVSPLSTRHHHNITVPSHTAPSPYSTELSMIWKKNNCAIVHQTNNLVLAKALLASGHLGFFDTASVLQRKTSRVILQNQNFICNQQAGTQCNKIICLCGTYEYSTGQNCGLRTHNKRSVLCQGRNQQTFVTLLHIYCKRMIDTK